MADAQERLEALQLDKVPEARMAEIIGTTKRALEGKRDRRVIPEGVWNKIDGRIFYSLRRYEAWLESQWACPQELNSLASPFAFASHGKASDDARLSHTHKHQKGLKRQPIYAIK
ncbi:hypothetical protein [Pseudomonas rhodesiae]|uniref:hypothetical protein n=1 Tax=Pseudomonas rhodesiae TaxID=76760 RepID=UPI002733BEBF|nr:hypothetical protein [Pseudomonas rhodesiae]WLG37650.1 hypothetical protein PSH93_16785 [Pseudomonas rhodesiae]